MDSELTQALQSWPQWIQQFQFDPTYGYLIDPTYKPTSFDYEALNQLLSQLASLNQSGEIINRVKNMKQIWIDKQKINYRDMVILHDCCSYLIHSFLKVMKDKQVPELNITIPKNLALPTIQSASFLRVKTGMATGIGYNWFFTHKLGDLDKMAINDIQIKYFYSTQRQYEELFFKVSVVTSFFLGRIIKNCYEINCIITLQPNLTSEVLARMKKIRFYLKRIFQQNLNIQQKMSKPFFFFVLRVFVAGYHHVTFQGLEQKVSSSGGAGGYDPSFQSFQRAFGLFFQEELGNIQDKLRHGMSEQNRGLIDFFAQHSIIRQYCSCDRQLQNAYNEVLQGYVKYLQLHGTFIKNFILDMIPTINQNPKAKYGENTDTIVKIIEKFKFVRQQQLSEFK